MVVVNENSSYTNTKTFTMEISDGNLSLVTFTWEQGKKQQTNVDGFEIRWETSGRLHFKGYAKVGDTQYAAGTTIDITVKKQNGSTITSEHYVVGNGTQTLTQNSSYYFHVPSEYPSQIDGIYYESNED